jgi:O-acetyl-ADP-ribose deacetylase (regulator of RNase III)
MAIKIGNTEVEIIKGDITILDVEAIVNPANNALMHGGGLAAEIVHRGGQIIQQESKKIGYVPTGSAVYTQGGHLKAKHVIHAVGPRYKDGNSGEKEKLESAVISSLNIADKLKLKSIALPAISSGIFGYPIAESSKIIIDSIVNFLETKDNEKSETNLEKIIVCLYDDGTLKEFEKAFKNIKFIPKKEKKDSEIKQEKHKTKAKKIVTESTKTKSKVKGKYEEKKYH